MPTYLSPGVYVEEVDSGSRPIEGVGTAVAAFVGLAESGPFNTPTLVSNWTQFSAKFGSFVEGTYLAHAVYGYFMNGGGNCYVVRIGDDGGNGSGDGRKELESAPQAPLGGRLRVVALDSGSKPGDIEVEIVEAGGESPTDEMFKLLVKQGGQVSEEYDRATVTRGKQNVATMVNAASKLIRIEDVGSGALEKPQTGTLTLTAPPPPAATPTPTLTTDDYVGDVADRTGFGGLEAVDEVTMVCVPDLMSAYQQGAIDLETVQAVQLGMIAHCELMGDRVAILDPRRG
jgi:Bacteriophage tail sheath protein